MPAIHQGTVGGQDDREPQIRRLDPSRVIGDLTTVGARPWNQQSWSNSAMSSIGTSLTGNSRVNAHNRSVQK